jgi:hypothetical protein
MSAADGGLDFRGRRPYIRAHLRMTPTMLLRTWLGFARTLVDRIGWAIAVGIATASARA